MINHKWAWATFFGGDQLPIPTCYNVSVWGGPPHLKFLPWGPVPPPPRPRVMINYGCRVSPRKKFQPNSPINTRRYAAPRAKRKKVEYEIYPPPLWKFLPPVLLDPRPSTTLFIPPNADQLLHVWLDECIVQVKATLLHRRQAANNIIQSVNEMHLFVDYFTHLLQQSKYWMPVCMY